MSVRYVFRGFYRTPMKHLVTGVTSETFCGNPRFDQPVESPVEAGDTIHQYLIVKCRVDHSCTYDLKNPTVV